MANMSMRKRIIILFILVTLCLAAVKKPTVAIPATLVNAIHQVESEGKMENVKAGDNGLAIGPLQIHKGYWQDAIEYTPSIGGQYSDCQSYDYSVKIVTAYMNRYAYKHIKSNNLEAIARIHNGGWNGYHKASTKKYWNKVKKHLSR